MQVLGNADQAAPTSGGPQDIRVRVSQVNLPPPSEYAQHPIGEGVVVVGPEVVVGPGVVVGARVDVGGNTEPQRFMSVMHSSAASGNPPGSGQGQAVKQPFATSTHFLNALERYRQVREPQGLGVVVGGLQHVQGLGVVGPPVVVPGGRVVGACVVGCTCSIHGTVTGVPHSKSPASPGLVHSHTVPSQPPPICSHPGKPSLVRLVRNTQPPTQGSGGRGGGGGGGGEVGTQLPGVQGSPPSTNLYPGGHLGPSGGNVGGGLGVVVGAPVVQ